MCRIYCQNFNYRLDKWNERVEIIVKTMKILERRVVSRSDDNNVNDGGGDDGGQRNIEWAS